MMNLLSKLNALLLLVLVLLHLLVIKNIWMVSGCTSKTYHLPFPVSIHHLHHRNGIPLLLSWLTSSLNSEILKLLLVSTLMRWILVSHVLKMIWVFSALLRSTYRFLVVFLCSTSFIVWTFLLFSLVFWLWILGTLVNFWIFFFRLLFALDI